MRQENTGSTGASQSETFPDLPPTPILPGQSPTRTAPAATVVGTPPLDDKLTGLLVSTSPSYWDAWLAGYQSGLVQGAAEKTLSQETMMDEIARCWEANRLLGEDVLAVMKRTISNIEVTANRRKTAQFTSSYKGGPVPWEPVKQGGGS